MTAWPGPRHLPRPQQGPSHDYDWQVTLAALAASDHDSSHDWPWPRRQARAAGSESVRHHGSSGSEPDSRAAADRLWEAMTVDKQFLHLLHLLTFQFN